MMSLTWNWVAIALSLTAAAPGNGNPGFAELKSAVGKIRRISGDRPDAPQITYRVRVVEMEGLGWREAWSAKLSPVAHRGAATVWTAPRRASQAIIDGASKIVVSPPKVTSYANAAAHFNSRTNRSLVTQVSWSDEEFKATPESIREGFAATIAGRKLDQGVLVQVVIDDTEIRSVHEIKLVSNEKLGAGVGAPPPPNEKEAEGAPRILQIPEVASQEVVGEWLIPNDGVLVVGLGIHTAGGKDGKAVVRERLMLIEANDAEVPRTASRRETPGNAPFPTPSASPNPLPAPVTPSPSAEPIPAPAPPTPSTNPMPMPTPTPPSRSLPQGVNADGTPAELPPLPEDDDLPEAADSAEPHGSPQNRTKAQPVPMPSPPKPDDKDKAIDTRASKASYTPGQAGGSPLAFPIGQRPADLPTNRVQWTPVKGRSFPASLSRWIESVRARGATLMDCDDEDCDDSACEDECRDEK